MVEDAASNELLFSWASVRRKTWTSELTSEKMAEL